MKNYKSLLIIGVPRSGSTSLERSCCRFLTDLGFERKGEILNPHFNPELDVRFNSRRKKDYEIFKNRCKENRHNAIIRDVVQNRFVIEHADMLKQWFNIIHIMRPVKETKLCCRLKGWKVDVVGWNQKLGDIPCDKGMKIINYNDFVLINPDKLYSILRKWYPCSKVDYMTPQFIKKREATFAKLGCHGITPEAILQYNSKNRRK